MTDPIRDKIIELVPEKTWVEPNCQIISETRALHGNTPRMASVTLADVLRAIEENRANLRCQMAIATDGQFQEFDGTHFDMRDGGRYMPMWDLTTDYDGQTEEVKRFLGTLLNVT